MSNVPWLASICGLCNRPLKTDKSREAGYGPVCLKKIEAERSAKQTNIDEYIEEPGE